MKPTLGLVIITMGAVTSNGSSEHPALINRVWSSGDTKDAPVCVNCTVLPDCGAPTCVTSIMLFEDRAAAEAAIPTYGGRVAFWPDRV